MNQYAVPCDFWPSFPAYGTSQPWLGIEIKVIPFTRLHWGHSQSQPFRNKRTLWIDLIYKDGNSLSARTSLFLFPTRGPRTTVFNFRELFTMPCKLCDIIVCVLIFGTLGFLWSLIVLAPFYFSTRWSEKWAVEKAIVIGFPCAGAFLGLIGGIRGEDQVSSRRPEVDRRSERQQGSSGVFESAQRPKTPEIRNQPTRTPGTIPRHLLPTLVWRLITKKW